jgi:hypothetical protein
MRDVVFLTEGVHHLSTANTQFSFEGVGTVVESCMNNLFHHIRRHAFVRGGVGGHTSEFRELVSIPTLSFLSISHVLVPSLAANCLAIANPTAPPPITYSDIY